MLLGRWLLVLVAVAAASGACAGSAVAVTPRAAVTVLAAAPVAATAKPDGGLRVSIAPDGLGGRASARQASVDVVSTRRAQRLVVVVRSTGVVRVAGPSRATLAANTGQPSRLPIDWVAERDGLGSLWTDVRSLDAVGRVLASRRATLFVLRSGGRVLTSTAGPLELRVRAVQALSGLSALVRAARVDRLLGGGARSSIAARATSGTAITVSGTVRFTDSAGNTHPARRVAVELRETTLTGSEIVQTVETDEDGRYATTLDRPASIADIAHLFGHNLFVRARAEGPGYSVAGSSGVHWIDSSVARDTADATALTIDLVANNVDDNNTAFSVAEAMAEVHDYLVKSAMALPAIEVDFPTADVSSYFGQGKLHMLRADRFDSDVAQHEYGHYVARSYAIANSPGGMHSGFQNLSETRGKDAGTRLAWGEGWPTYFGTSLQQVLGLSALGIPHVGDTRYTDTEDANVDYDLERPTTKTAIGEDGEFSVQRFLWDVYDAERDTGDAVRYSDRTIMSTLTTARVVTFAQAYAALTSDLPERARIALGCIAAQQRISPTITSPENGSPLPDAPPTIEWTPNGGGPTYRNNTFVVRFYDASFTTLLHQTSELEGVTHFRPTPTTWEAVTHGRSEINVVVTGSQTDPPATGPYDGCATQLGS